MSLKDKKEIRARHSQKMKELEETRRLRAITIYQNDLYQTKVERKVKELTAYEIRNIGSAF